MKCIKSSLFLMLFVLCTSCETDDDSVDMGQEQFAAADVTMLRSTANTGTWRISRFIEDDEDITNFFQGFRLTFNDDGSLVVENETLTLNGTWRIDFDDDDDDLEFELSIATSSNDLDEEFDELTEDWDVVSFSDNRITLSDDDEVDDDQLVLERI